MTTLARMVTSQEKWSWFCSLINPKDLEECLAHSMYSINVCRMLNVFTTVDLRLRFLRSAKSANEKEGKINLEYQILKGKDHPVFLGKNKIWNRQTISTSLPCLPLPCIVFNKLLFSMFCLGWILLHPVCRLAPNQVTTHLVTHIWSGGTTFDGPYWEPFQSRALPRFSRNFFLGTFLQCTDSSTFWGTDNLCWRYSSMRI